MIILQTIEIHNFRNIKHIKLDFKELNILIGPNNCGKTNLLEFISRLSNLRYGPYSYGCKECQEFNTNVGMGNVSLSLDTMDFCMNDPKKEMRIRFLLNEEEIDKMVPGILEKQRKKLEFNPALKIRHCGSIKDEINIKNEKGDISLFGEHLSPFIHESVIQEINSFILYCPEGRLQSYKQKGLKEYVRDRQLRTAQKKRWISFLQRVIDPKVDDERYENLIMKVDGEDFETEISKQGSGVRSLICLAVDILFSNEKKLILIDEPELGLNPFVKQEFLKFLLNECKEKQIFVATQDPTFVNPIFWKDNNVSIYLYSIIDEEFHKIDIKQNQEDPNTFAGYLPHTISLKDTHIYVEGTSDVYLFQVLLEKYLRENFQENWFEVINEVGIHHLCGDFWQHLLYTIPKHPYKCIVILDGDKRDNAEKVCKKYNESKVHTSKFVFCSDAEDIKKAFEGEYHPIYCLEESCIEKYLFTEFNCAKIPENYDKKRDGPKKAEKLQEIPEEITEIFFVIFGTKKPS